jgi:1-acyl-sn-glycerol-3-phosphate acyltransferase
MFLSIIRSAVAFSFFIVFVLCFFIWSLITLRHWNVEISSPLLKYWSRITLWMLGIQINIEGDWPFGDETCRICICNHQSTLDIIWFCAICPPRLGSVGKKELKWIPVLNLVWWSLKLYYVHRGDRQKALNTFEALAQDMQKQSRSLSLSPEGTRTKDGRISKFKKGAFYLAIQAKAPIYPLVVSGAYEAMPKGSFWTKPGHIHVRFLERIDTYDWSIDKVDIYVQQTQKKMEKAYQQLRADIGLEDLE